MKKLFGIAVLLTGFVVAASAQQTQPTTPEKRHEMRKERKEWRQDVKEDLNLTDAQQTQLKAINESARDQAKAVKENNGLSAEQKKAQMKAIHKERHEKMKAILTPEQQEKMRHHRKGRPGKRQV